MTDQVQIEPVTPNLPLVLCDKKFIATLTEVEAQVAAVKITDAQTAQHAANLQIRLTEAGKKLDATRLELKRPFIDHNKRIDDAARGPAERIEKAKNALRRAQIQWDIDQRRIAEEAEKARQAEIARLEAIKKKEAEEAARKAAEIAKAAADAAKGQEIMEVDFGDEPAAPPAKTATELELDRVKYAPAPVVAKPAGIAFRVSLRHKVEKIADVPDTFIIKTVNDAGIRATFCNGYKEGEPLPVCPGVTFWVEKTPISTGKVEF